MPQQQFCCGWCKILEWYDVQYWNYIKNKSTANLRFCLKILGEIQPRAGNRRLSTMNSALAHILNGLLWLWILSVFVAGCFYRKQEKQVVCVPVYEIWYQILCTYDRQYEAITWTHKITRNPVYSDWSVLLGDNVLSDSDLITHACISELTLPTGQ